MQLFDTIENRAYSNRATGFPVVGIDVLKIGGDEPQSFKQCGFFTSGFALNGLAGRGAARLTGAVPGTSTRLVSPPQLTLRCAVHQIERRYTMTTPSRKPAVKLVHGKATTTSLQVAQYFGKRHTNVLRAIENLKCTDEFRRLNFEPSSYLNEQGKEQPYYILTRNGFTLLAFGFNGIEAVAWKEKYIHAFEALEQKVFEQAIAKASRGHAPKALPPPTRAIPPARYHYPRALLDQPHFVTPVTGKATLKPAMLANTEHFISPLLALLNQLRSEGHDVSGPLDEAVALRNALRIADTALEEISTLAIQGRFTPAEDKKA